MIFSRRSMVAIELDPFQLYRPSVPQEQIPLTGLRNQARGSDIRMRLGWKIGCGGMPCGRFQSNETLSQ